MNIRGEPFLPWNIGQDTHLPNISFISFNLVTSFIYKLQYI